MPLGMLGKYERLDVLGHGASGIVYLAKDTLLNKQVALKEVDVQACDVTRFLEEARVMDRLHHPNIVRVNGVERIDGRIVIDMEYVRGENLQDILRNGGPMEVKRALDIMAQTLDALDYAHRMQTVHRDIKPANILVRRDGVVKLVDFGLAEILSTNAYAGGAGTYAYMAPEDFAEEARSDSQSDIWAAGITLFEAITGQRPFQVERMKDPFSWKRALDTTAPTRVHSILPDAPADLQRVLDKALARDKRQRYASAGEFRDDLRRLLAGAEVSTAAVAAAPLPLLETESVPYTAPRELRTGPSVVVAEVAPEAPQPETRPLLPFRRRSEVETVSVEPRQVQLGSVRKGENASVSIKVRLHGGTGPAQGRVTRAPTWLEVHPLVFTRTRQSIVFTAFSDRVWETGEFRDTVRIETRGGTMEVPVSLQVLKPRPPFSRVAFWFVPLFAAAFLPVLALVFGHASTAFEGLVPAAELSTALLGLMLMGVGIGADIGINERIAAGVIPVVMMLLMGITLAMPGTTAAHHTPAQRAFDVLRAPVALGQVTAGYVAGLCGIILVAVLLLQAMYLSRWRVWASVLVGLAVLMAVTFAHILRVG